MNELCFFVRWNTALVVIAFSILEYRIRYFGLSPDFTMYPCIFYEIKATTSGSSSERSVDWASEIGKLPRWNDMYKLLYVS